MAVELHVPGAIDSPHAARRDDGPQFELPHQHGHHYGMTTARAGNCLKGRKISLNEILHLATAAFDHLQGLSSLLIIAVHNKMIKQPPPWSQDKMLTQQSSFIHLAI